jgi:hypothetical protein
MRRFALGTEATISWVGGAETTSYIQFTETGEEGSDPACIGYAIDVDGVVVRFSVLRTSSSAFARNRPCLPHCVLHDFRDLVREDPVLTKQPIFFCRDWLTQIHTSALISLALTRTWTLLRPLPDSKS